MATDKLLPTPALDNYGQLSLEWLCLLHNLSPFGTREQLIAKITEAITRGA